MQIIICILRQNDSDRSTRAVLCEEHCSSAEQSKCFVVQKSLTAGAAASKQVQQKILQRNSSLSRNNSLVDLLISLSRLSRWGTAGIEGRAASTPSNWRLVGLLLEWAPRSPHTWCAVLSLFCGSSPSSSFRRTAHPTLMFYHFPNKTKAGEMACSVVCFGNVTLLHTKLPEREMRSLFRKEVIP